MTPEKHRARRETLEAACHTTWYQVSLTQGLKLEKSTQKEKGSLSVLHEATTGLGDACLNTESNLFLIKASRYQHLLSLYLQYLTHILDCFLLCPFFWPSIFPASRQFYAYSNNFNFQACFSYLYSSAKQGVGTLWSLTTARTCMSIISPSK